MKYIEAFDYEDILIKPSHVSDFESRIEVDIHNEYGHVPVCAANMVGVGTFEMALELGKHDMLTFIQKHCEVDEWDEYQDNLNWNCTVPTFGITDTDFVKYKEFIDRFSVHVKYICIDVANGHMNKVITQYKKYQEYAKHVRFIVGNIANPTTLIHYSKAGIWGAKVGIGSGSVCTTRKVTGVGFPQATLVDEMYSVKKHYNSDIKIIADGGIKEIGDITKAFVLGADYVMCGGMFAGYKESSELFNENDSIMFRGSSAIQEKDYVTPEGKIVLVPYRGEVKDLAKDIKGGLRSAGTYLNSHVEEFHECRDYLILTRRQTNEIFSD